MCFYLFTEDFLVILIVSSYFSPLLALVRVESSTLFFLAFDFAPTHPSTDVNTTRIYSTSQFFSPLLTEISSFTESHSIAIFRLFSG